MNRKFKTVSLIILLTATLTWFFYYHETLPKPLRAATALLETPVAMASGIFYYLDLGIPVYDSAAAVIIINAATSILIVYLIQKFLRSNGNKKS